MATASQTPVAVITGASSGIGRETAKALAAAGWRVIAIGRNPERCRKAETAIRGKAPDPERVTMVCADLAIMAETARAADRIGEFTDRVDVLLNNAGGVTRELTITPEGNENTFASNHLGHFLLTQRLSPLLRRSVLTMPAGTTRIISVSSTGHEQCDGLDWNDLQTKQGFVSGHAYCRAKLANLLFTRELAKRLGPEGIIAHAMHPGVVNSNFVTHADDTMQHYMRSIEHTGKTPEEAADTLIWLAMAEEPGRNNGEYYHQRRVVPTSEHARDDDAAARLWRESEALVEPWMGRSFK